MTKDEIKHINWMYNRLTSVHKENPNLDYMIKFKEIIDQQLTIPVVSDTLILTPNDVELFFNEIMNPKEANEALKKAMLKFITR